MAVATAPPDRSSSVLTWMHEVEREFARRSLDQVPVGMAPEVIEGLARLERRFSATRVRLSHRVDQAGLAAASGDRDAASFASRLSGSSVGRARAELALAERLEELPRVDEAFAKGELTTEQAQVVARAAAADPGATDALLAVAGQGSFGDLKRLAAGIERAARSEEDERCRERRLHAGRWARTWTPAEGGLRLDAHFSSVEGARVLAALTKKTDELLAGSDDTLDHVRADALVALVGGEGVRTEVLVRATASALVRGETHGDETCEIDGVGPVAVSVARSLLGEAFLTLVVADGADVATVTSTSRVVPTKVQKALLARDPVCVVPGCTAAIGLEIDHWRLEFSKGGLTALDNLCRLCSLHHRQKTDGTLVLSGGPGNWTVTTPKRTWGARAGPD
jgi:hypothetical protein